MASMSWIFVTAVLVALLSFHGFCSAEQPPNYSFLRQATGAPKVAYYDYIVVGGGTAGCPLAATLSEKANVLVLERGDSPYGNVNSSNIRGYTNLLADTSPTSASQPFKSEDGVNSNRPRVLGGGSAINAGFYSRAEREWVLDLGLDEKLVNQSYRWVERVIVHDPVYGPWQSAVRAGMIDAGVVPDNGYTYDHLVGTKASGTLFDADGARSTAADLFVYAIPTKITIFLHATVQRVLFTKPGKKSKPKAIGVLYKDANGGLHWAYLKGGAYKNEIILSAGALGSPQLMLLSGIGPKDQLKSFNIPLVLDQPLVGSDMADNPLNALFVPLVIRPEISLTLSVGITSFGSYIECASGMNLFGGTLEQYGGFDYKDGGYIVEKITGPLSSGFLELKNLDPSDNPKVTFNYFQEPLDLQRCIGGVQTILDIIASPSMATIRNTSVSLQRILEISSTLPHSLPSTVNTSKSLEQFCKDTVGTIWHYHGGCQTGKVVDSDYQVIGIEGLRVLDGSTFLTSPGTNPQATLMMLGRYLGVKITRERVTIANDLIDGIASMF